MDLEEFCSLRDIELLALAQNVDSAVGLEPHDVLLAVGSLVEGLGNNRSDLDLLLVTPRSEVVYENIAVAVGGTVVDVRVLAVARVDALVDRLERWQRLSWSVTHAAGFELDDRILLHRLAHARTVWPTSPADFRRPSTNVLPRLKLHVARQMSRTVQVDLAGYLETEDYESLVFSAQDLLGHAVDALLAAHGFSNPLPKWRTRLLSLLPSDWEVSAMLRPSGLSASERVWSLHRAPPAPDGRSSLEHALQIVSFARVVFLSAERRLGLNQGGLRLLDWPDVSAIGESASLPYLDVDIDFECSNGEMALGRLNDVGETLHLSASEFQVALLCDGITTSLEAEAVVGAGREVVANALSHLESVGFLRALSPA